MVRTHKLQCFDTSFSNIRRIKLKSIQFSRVAKWQWNSYFFGNSHSYPRNCFSVVSLKPFRKVNGPKVRKFDTLRVNFYPCSYRTARYIGISSIYIHLWFLLVISLLKIPEYSAYMDVAFFGQSQHKFRILIFWGLITSPEGSILGGSLKKINFLLAIFGHKDTLKAFSHHTKIKMRRFG